jgi:hypothetical protein
MNHHSRLPAFETSGKTMKTRSLPAIITTRANELLASIHDRMPVILPSDSYERNSSSRSSIRGRLSLPKEAAYF